MLFRQRGDLDAVLGDQRFVGRSRQPCPNFQRRLDRQLGGAVRSADQFDDDIDIVIHRREFDRIIDPFEL